MIYKISEYIATLIEVIIFFKFLVKVLNYKDYSFTTKVLSFGIAVIIQTLLLSVINYYYTFEGILSLVNILVYFMFSLIFLKGKVYYKVIVVIIPFLCLFGISVFLSMVANVLTGMATEEILQFRNPTRVFMLIFSKILFVCILLIIGKYLLNVKSSFTLGQIITMIITFAVILIVGTLLMKIQISTNLFEPEFIVISSGLIFIIILVFLVSFQFNRQNELRENNQNLQYQIKLQQNKIYEVTEWNENLRKIKHDINNHFLCITQNIQNGLYEEALSYINSVSDRINVIIPVYYMTGTPELDAILNNKKDYCLKNGIDFKCVIGQVPSNINVIDLCVVISNLIDNAIEASEKEENAEINVYISVIGNYFRIIVKNRISESVLSTNNTLKTTKSDTDAHGYGIRSVKDTIKKYNGQLNFDEHDNFFIADVLLKK